RDDYRARGPRAVRRALRAGGRAMMARTGPAHEPRNLVERAGDAALEAVDATLAAGGAELDHVLVILHATGVPAGEQDVCECGSGFENPRDLLAELLTYAIQVGRELGVDVRLHPLLGGPLS